MLDEHADRDPVDELRPIADVGAVRAAQAALAGIEATEALRRYVVAVCEATRRDERVELGASPRAGLMLFRAAKALAALDGRDHVLPDDVQVARPLGPLPPPAPLLRGRRRPARGGGPRSDRHGPRAVR